MTKLLKHGPSQRIFFLLYNQGPLTTKEILIRLYPNKVIKNESFEIKCKNCGTINFKSKEKIEKIKNRWGTIPDFKCKCKYRILKGYSKDEITNLNLIEKSDLSIYFFKSRSGTFRKNEITELIELRLIKREGKKFAVNYEGFFNMLPFPPSNKEESIQFLKENGRRNLNLAKSQIGHLILSAFLFQSLSQKEVEKDIYDIMLNISRSLGKINPDEMRALFSRGYADKLTVSEKRLLMSLHQECRTHYLEDIEQHFDFYDKLAYELNPVIFKQSEKRMIKRLDFLPKECGPLGVFPNNKPKVIIDET